MPELPKTTACQQVSPENLAANTAKVVLLDVRSPIEFETEHIANSINIPLEELDARCDELPRQSLLTVICRSGKRAERGAYTLLGKGFQAEVLEGGLIAWRKAGLSVKEGKKMLPIERQIQLVVGIGVSTGVLLGAFVNPWFLVIPGFFGAGLTFAGLSGTCALGLLLLKAPWNQIPVPGRTAGMDNRKPDCCN